MFETLLTEDNVLERVDAYSIYSFYIGSELEVGRVYLSPLREDDIKPSFSLYEYKGTLFFRDHGKGISGNVFKFIKILFGFNTSMEVLSAVNKDFDLELQGGIPYVKGEKAPLIASYKKKAKLVKIEVASRKNQRVFLEYLMEYGITKRTSDYYEATEAAVLYFHYEDNLTRTVYPKTLCIAYPIYDKYKIYQPFEDQRFFNNYPSDYVEGFLQLKYEKDFCIITKSTKEIMFFREHYDWDTVAGKSESTHVTRVIMLILLKRFKKIYIWLDNDTTGLARQALYLQEYPFLIPVYFNVPQKDPTDFYKTTKNKAFALSVIKKQIEI
jgi:hypothetical protein